MILIGRGLDQGQVFKRRVFRRVVFTLFGFEGKSSKSGGNSEEVPPVPIPNTEVKLLSVYDTWRETARENGTLPEQS